MGTVYVTQLDAFIGKTDERLSVKADKKNCLDVPLIKIDGVVVLERATVSPALVYELLERKIPLSFIKVTGKYLGRLEPEMTKNIFVRKAQWQAAGETEQAIHVVRGFVRGKLKNYRNSLLRREREFSQVDLQANITRLEQAIAPIYQTNNINSPRPSFLPHSEHRSLTNTNPSLGIETRCLLRQLIVLNQYDSD